MESVIVKLLFVAYMLLPTDDVKVEVVVVDQCPPQKLVSETFDYKLKNNEIKGWNARCEAVPFGTKPFAKIEYNG